MDSRRDFIKKAALLSTGAGFVGMLPPSIQKALAINPDAGTTFHDAEHIVILMQENRSFDHSYGTLQGVRGFDDPRAIRKPDGNLVWAQTNARRETYAPFRLNIKDTKATWMSALPHSWENQVDAFNDGKNDKWLDVKQSGNKDYKALPLTMGYYDRNDIPFYYALADAFTVCDQNFCSSLTGTTPNRLYLWSGTIREKQTFESKANVQNSDVSYGSEASWKTFPERLEEAGISWRIYQNELSVPVGFEGPEESWLANFTNNPLEWMRQYNVWYSVGFQKFLPKALERIKSEITELETKQKQAGLSASEKQAVDNQLNRKKNDLNRLVTLREKYPVDGFEKLSQKEKNLHQKAFTSNINDPDYHSVTTLDYKDGDINRKMHVPKGDVLHQFREDVKNNKLPTVTWLIAPENFSDHPGAPWYGAWYLSESLDILTQNPEIWKKTVFILCYDENDGYYDHVPPFTAPRPDVKNSGKVSKGIDPSVEMANIADELKRTRTNPERDSRDGPIGLGFRVPLVVASPWSRGGLVNSEVFDHTSILQFLEVFLSKKTGKKIEESNISSYRRAVCGDLTSVFRPYNGEKIDLPAFVKHDPFVESIHKAQFKKLPEDFKLLTPEQIQQLNAGPSKSPFMPKQEKGTRGSSPLPYELYADYALSADRQTITVRLTAGNTLFKGKSAGAPFRIYNYGNNYEIRNYAVIAGDTLADEFPVSGDFHLAVYGPNGFFREFKGNSAQTALQVSFDYGAKNGTSANASHPGILTVKNTSGKTMQFSIGDNSYGAAPLKQSVAAGVTKKIPINFQKSFGWYDLLLTVENESKTAFTYAGRIENGKISKTDPVIGRG